VATYNVYRAAGGSSTYQLVASSNTSSAYVDNSVATNTTYAYYVTSVASDGSESVPSNTTSVTVP
jgi:fibronectin type 3 domain-containing protein